MSSTKTRRFNPTRYQREIPGLNYDIKELPPEILEKIKSALSEVMQTPASAFLATSTDGSLTISLNDTGNQSLVCPNHWCTTINKVAWHVHAKMMRRSNKKEEKPSFETLIQRGAENLYIQFYAHPCRHENLVINLGCYRILKVSTSYHSHHHYELQLQPDSSLSSD